MRLGAENPHWKGGKVARTCVVCGAAFAVYPSRLSTAKCCSRACSSTLGAAVKKGRAKPKPPKKGNLVAPGPFCPIRPASICGHLTKAKRAYCAQCLTARSACPKDCAVCGKTFTVRQSEVSKKVVCSPECSRVWRSLRQQGEKSHRWQGGKTPATVIERGDYRVQDWRKAVFARDGYTCQACGSIGGRLTADHVLPWSLFPEARFDVENGRTLCWPCHLALPTTGWKLALFTEAVRHAADGLDPKAYAALMAVVSPPSLFKSTARAAFSAWQREALR
jgi:5-methylcytosine-specific restriction endonuclease McrA